VIDRVEQVYGVGPEAYSKRTEERDRQTRAILEARERATTTCGGGAQRSEERAE
jgi:hypothetical protein